nr:probable methyltransferase TARBP1 isoform X5 [Osmia lignaria]
MDLHERYMRSTMDFSVFELSETAFKDDPLLLLHRIVKYYNNEIMKDNFDTKKLETFRIVLCYEYQLLFNSKEKNIKVTASDLCFKTIESILFLKKHSQNFTEHPILYDIIILQLILYCNLQCIEEHLMNFQKSNVDVLNNDESKFFYIKILECFLESLQLRHLLYNNADLSILKHFSLLYLKDIITWLEMKENKEWQLFTSIFPKLISTCSSENILPIIWNVILNKLDDFKDLLSALSIIVNVCFSSNFINDVIHTHYKLFYTEQLWLLIIKSLKSPIQQYRKQGLFIMKHITNFMNITNENVLKLKIPSIVPFVCGQKTETKILIKDIKQKFFLILDALEEKQHHLILPALTNLSTLIKEIASILKTIINKGAIKDIEDKLHLESIFTLCWKSTLLSKKNKLYFIAIKDLVGVVINDNFLKLPDVMHFVNNFLDQLLEESNNVPKLKQILLNEMESLNTCYLKNLQEPLVSCCLHGHVLRRDKQIENQAYLYVTQNYRNYYPRHISIIDYNNDTSVRALSIILLYKIINADKEYASMLLPIVLQKLEKFRNKRYFNHSYIHKIKHRIMQILLILQPILNKLDIVILEDCLCNLMLLESNQHSIRLMQEWILIKIFVENIELHYKLWKFFEEGITTRPGCVSSIACIVYHVSRLLPSDSQCDFILMGIKYIAHCCLGQQYSMRLYNQIIFVKLYKMLEQFNCNDTIVQYKGLYDAAIASLKYGNLAINSSKIQDDFYFSVFHAVHDFSLQTIYFELPRLTDMDPSEWITPDLFQILNFKETINHPLQLYNLNTLLSDTKTSSYLMKSTVDKESSVKNSMMDIEELNNIQKKIDPLMPTNISHNDIFSTIRESVSHKRLSDEDGLIVVACLVNRAPNLGGLARTCEIFNVKELVIANLNQIKDKEFQNLSVSAENWITITEVKPHQLCKFLLDKKEMGWSLVGLEQTVNSVNLINMKFKKKTILVLGNEKDGIPANLISLFDTCIEIPQAGIIRSLNVHVSGAICIWQYSKQHVLI